MKPWNREPEDAATVLHTPRAPSPRGGIGICTAALLRRRQCRQGALDGAVRGLAVAGRQSTASLTPRRVVAPWLKTEPTCARLDIL